MMVFHPFPPKTKFQLLHKLRIRDFKFDLFPVETRLQLNKVKAALSKEDGPFEVIVIKAKPK